MKIFIILSMAVMSMASLEPSDYRPPGSQTSSDQYLPPRYPGSSPRGVQTPESHYLPSSHQSSPQNVIPNSRYLPSNHVQTPQHTSASAAAAAALPTNQYLPARQPARATRRRPSDHVQNSVIGSRVSSPTPQSIAGHMSNQNILPSQYLPPSQRPETFTQAIPSSSYLPANQNQYPTGINQPSESIVPPSDSYLTPNMFNPSGGYSASHHDSHDVHSSSSSLSQPAGQYYPDSGYPAATANQGYNYDQPPAHSEFEYHVNDEYGNDYSHKESRNGDNTEGMYTVLLPDGRKQIVRYKADRDGYRPTITYEDAAVGQTGYNQGYQY